MTNIDTPTPLLAAEPDTRQEERDEILQELKNAVVREVMSELTPLLEKLKEIAQQQGSDMASVDDIAARIQGRIDEKRTKFE